MTSNTFEPFWPTYQDSKQNGIIKDQMLISLWEKIPANMNFLKFEEVIFGFRKKYMVFLTTYLLTFRKLSTHHAYSGPHYYLGH
jgi:hypothetical protein